ncbi:D-lactaldehyde dehydrogenase [Auricularia subglabra TFB-10046 SS5]|nr:D-lactaldehyde dehydrogenase [Auricularia subglabra TFB-10046 SS5]
MPAVAPPATVLVTGANGFVGSWIARRLLDAGFAVHGAVRSAAKGEDLLRVFSREHAEGRFRLVLVPDICADGAFDEAVRNVEGIVHTASPNVPSAPDNDPSHVINPAVQGTLGIMRSAYTHGKRVRRIVFTGTGGTMLQPHPENPNHIYSADDYNEHAIEFVEREGKRAPFVMQYYAAKTRADKAVWAFIRDTKPHFDAVILLPPAVVGPELLPKRRIDELNESNVRLFKRFAEPFPEDRMGRDAFPWIDVRPNADSHVQALLCPEVSNRRLSVQNPSTTNQAYYDAYHALRPPPLPFPVTRGKPGVKARKLIQTRDDSGVLGVQLTTLQESIHDTLVYVIETGLVKTSQCKL